MISIFAQIFSIKLFSGNLSCANLHFTFSNYKFRTSVFRHNFGGEITIIEVVVTIIKSKQFSPKASCSKEANRVSGVSLQTCNLASRNSNSGPLVRASGAEGAGWAGWRVGGWWLAARPRPPDRR